MKNNFTLNWTLVNALGLALGFLAFIQTLHFYSYGLNFELHWDFEAGQNMANSMPQAERAMYLLKGLSLALPVFGMVYTASQALVLGKYLKKIWRWVLNGLIGFLLVILIVYPFSSVWGDIPGPVEPFAIVFGGAVITLILQWRYLKKNGLAPGKLFLWYLLGILIGLIGLFVLYLVGLNVSWALEIAIIGLITGASSGFFSARHFYKELNRITAS